MKAKPTKNGDVQESLAKFGYYLLQELLIKCQTEHQQSTIRSVVQEEITDLLFVQEEIEKPRVELPDLV